MHHQWRLYRMEVPAGRHLALLDDAVVTTGSTVGELVKILIRAGMERVDVWAVAKTA